MQPTDYVKIVGASGRCFYVHYHCATVSETLRSMLESGFREERERCITFNDIEEELLEWCLDYVYYYRQCECNWYGTELPRFPVPEEKSLQLLSVANYLNL
ncbi:elongin C [Cyanidioschyzon merolae strain 10D]|jgi:hypothetical protein|uniref:Elongin-C n=1 Tax=Cyanidioschyzon merolae (strain NIES-3377 / 10D) TaxID=280699 RepID=M1VAP7_CYAM1|nr:elongin C [Cyanidioschyzon merolae strain 10D]BAM79227.1 elongin C [Cyanidioschyzon merolae strain 10D]|eukprot:XP_005535513.1 elongin C [Cyanidioschyzon merolae strain 10D]